MRNTLIKNIAFLKYMRNTLITKLSLVNIHEKYMKITWDIHVFKYMRNTLILKYMRNTWEIHKQIHDKYMINTWEIHGHFTSVSIYYRVTLLQ